MCKESEIKQIIETKESYYYISHKQKVDKKGNPKIGIDGKIEYRVLNPSRGRLKEIQSIIKSRILSKISLPTNIKGGVKGNDNIANAKVHLGKKHKFKTDIKKFFPSISYKRVFKMYLENGFSAKVATLLTHLTTHRYELPQGTPTSTHIANLVFLPNDLQIIDLCAQNSITYTRFVDDLVFSSQKDFRVMCDDIIKVILKDGYKISYKKTKYRAGNMEITGVVTKQNVLDVSDDFKNLLADKTIVMTKTQGRKKYYDNVRKSK